LNNGSFEAPFATFGKAITTASALDTIYARGGTYNLSSKLTISKAGNSTNPMKLFAYEGETPILNFASQPLGGSNRGVELSSSADYWHIKGLTIQNAGDNGFVTNGDRGLFEQIVTRFNRDSGFQFGGSASFNVALNCDSYGNYDAANRGENADGFAVKSTTIGQGNIFSGNRSWDNSDDGWDMFESRANGVLIMNSWAFDNGFDPGGAGAFRGDGNGFKLGHDSGSHVLAGLLAVSNPTHGIDVNGVGYIYDEDDNPIMPNGNLVQVYNSTSFDNGGKNFMFDEDLPHTLRNNISYSGGDDDDFEPLLVADHNTWDGPAFAVSAADFASVDLGDGMAQQIAQVLRGPRQVDGSLPDVSPFLHLVAGSNLVNAGVAVSFTFGGQTYSLPYNGAAPDLGAFEFVATGPALPGDFNGDHVVDAADYVAWMKNLGAPNEANINNSGNGGDVSDADYTLWQQYFNNTLQPGAGGNANVPEPTACLTIALIVGCLSITARRP
jgi:hypothetical protein